MKARRDPSGTSQSVEDFLKAVYNLQGDGDRVSTNALADALNISAPAVTDMAQRLVDEGTVDYLKYRGVRLTNEGERVALQMLRRHRLIETYLVQDLGYQLHEIHEEAEALEHTVSDRFVEAIARKMGEPRYDPHGDPIPNLEGIMQERNLQPLSTLRANSRARIRRFIMDDPAMLQNTQERGLVMGETLEVVERDPFDGPVTVRLGASKTQTIGYKMASAILVEFIDRLC
ncbi:MAG: metal-dependent transcriptional regulator [Chloroflexota bacterium]|nr:metal-dependent transcriptional regulator [Chloroflexota bacterium]MDE2908788.1 metal-dependent transcriptional regulator [Chloroflexota bacterium]